MGTEPKQSARAPTKMATQPTGTYTSAFVWAFLVRNLITTRWLSTVVFELCWK